METTSHEKALAEVVRRLSMRFADVQPDVVAGAVARAADQLQAARIREFVPVLVEKQAYDEVAAASANGSTAVPAPRSRRVAVTE